MANHLPLYGRKAHSHAVEGDTADPFGPITCHQCRKMLMTKVRAHSKLGVGSKSAQERRFYSKDAAAWQAVLAR